MFNAGYNGGSSWFVVARPSARTRSYAMNNAPSGAGGAVAMLPVSFSPLGLVAEGGKGAGMNVGKETDIYDMTGAQGWFGEIRAAGVAHEILAIASRACRRGRGPEAESTLPYTIGLSSDQFDTSVAFHEEPLR